MTGTTDDAALRVLLYWLLFPALAIPAHLAARALGREGFLGRILVWFAIVPAFLLSAGLGPLPFAVVLAAAGSVACVEIAAAAGRVLPRAQARRRSAALCAAVAVLLAFWVLLELEPGGPGLVAFAFSVVSVHDIMAFYAGRTLGRTRPFPTLSPNKTVAGYAVGAVTALLAALLIPFAVPELSPLEIAVGALVLIVFGSAGDLAASAIKRRHGAKDFGRSLGPMGGMLDRLDSLLGAGWAFYVYLELVLA